ncbi:hypothetical protein QYF61_000392 [Mycteria americana]|uniref:Uncharacterized protein n=1 Tax=Mycteria americana TaxID=33587 RepID=A0AAN7RPZ2_MYCAM|nr:hypothetical protein QYF61_000392 [Mycteria americana]
MQNLAPGMEQPHPPIQAEDDYLESSLTENDLGVLAGNNMKKDTSTFVEMVAQHIQGCSSKSAANRSMEAIIPPLIICTLDVKEAWLPVFNVITALCVPGHIPLRMRIRGRAGLWFAHLHIVKIDSAFSSCIEEKLRVHFIQQDVHRHSASSSIQHLKQQIHISENVHHYGYHLGKECKKDISDLEYKYLMEGCKEDGAKLFSVVRSERTRHKLKYRKFQLNIRKTSFTARVIEHWNRLPRKVVESPSLEILKDMS